MSLTYTSASLPAQSRARLASAFSAPGGAEVPVYKQVITWLLFWPLLTMIAGQTVYFSGPARDATTYQIGSVGGSNYHAALYVHLLFLFCFAITGRRKVQQALKDNPGLPLSLALAAGSALWSASAQISLQMSIEVSLSTFFACYISYRYRPAALMKLVLFMGVAASALSIAFALLLPSHGIFAGYGGGAWQGICNHKNTLGVSTAYLLTPVFFIERITLRRKVLYSALLLFMIAMSQSRGAWIDTAAMLGFVGLLFMHRRFRKTEALLLSVCAFVACAILLAAFVMYSSAIFAVLGKDSSASGRVPIYYEVAASIGKRIFFGYGFGAFWSVNPESIRIGAAIGWTQIGYAENGFLELALQTGIVGVGLVVYMIGRAVAQALRLMRSGHYRAQVGWFLTVIVLTLLTNIDGGVFMSSDSLSWLLLVTAIIGMNSEAKRARARSRGAVFGA
jgi:exopolysaccharide production protein ExoQ